MRQILFRIPLPGSEHALTIYGYGAMLCIGFLLAILLAARRAKRLGQSPDVIYNVALFCFFGGLIGARLFYVIQYGEHFRSPLDFLKIWEGGLTFCGGFLLAIVAAIGYLRFAKQPILYWLDIIAPSVALGEAFGRLGCFLNGCCYGDVCPAGRALLGPPSHGRRERSRGSTMPTSTWPRSASRRPPAAGRRTGRSRGRSWRCGTHRRSTRPNCSRS